MDQGHAHQVHNLEPKCGVKDNSLPLSVTSFLFRLNTCVEIS